MKRIRLLTLVSLVSFGIPTTAQQSNQPPSAATYVSASDVQSILARGGGEIARGDRFGINVIKRAQNSEAGRSEIHEKRSHVVHVVSGDALFVVGGTLTDRSNVSAGEIRGSGIDGGRTITVGPGEFLAIPEGTPHWLKGVPEDLLYYVFNVDKP